MDTKTSDNHNDENVILEQKLLFLWRDYGKNKSFLLFLTSIILQELWWHYFLSRINTSIQTLSISSTCGTFLEYKENLPKNFWVGYDELPGSLKHEQRQKHSRIPIDTCLQKDDRSSSMINSITTEQRNFSRHLIEVSK